MDSLKNLSSFEMFTRYLLILSMFQAGISAQQAAWGQCGGKGWTGEASCVSGYACSSLNSYYYQCVSATAIAIPTSTTQRSTTYTSGQITPTVISTSPITSTSATSTAIASGTTPPSTLLSGYYWIRAVASPNYHSYLQAAPTAIPSPGPGDAYLLSSEKAGQFKVVDGQLFYNAGSAQMYMGVENSPNKTQRTLETWFNTTKNDYGMFAFSGDTLTWEVSDISRPNTAAWLVCGDAGQLYVNTGAYAYDTPEGCADQTIHSYGGSTTNV